MATRCISAAGFKATCIDMDDAKRAGYAEGSGTVFDILSASGFVLLGFHSAFLASVSEASCPSSSSRKRKWLCYMDGDTLQLLERHFPWFNLPLVLESTGPRESNLRCARKLHGVQVGYLRRVSS